MTELHPDSGLHIPSGSFTAKDYRRAKREEKIKRSPIANMKRYQARCRKMLRNWVDNLLAGPGE